MSGCLDCMDLFLLQAFIYVVMFIDACFVMSHVQHNA